MAVVWVVGNVWSCWQQSAAAVTYWHWPDIGNIARDKAKQNASGLNDFNHCCVVHIRYNLQDVAYKGAPRRNTVNVWISPANIKALPVWLNYFTYD